MRKFDTLAHCDICFVITIEIATDKSFLLAAFRRQLDYKGSFFPQTIRDWNALPDSLLSSAEVAEDCVAKFTSLVRARD